MRSRPRVKLTLAPGVIYPGTTFRADLHVESDDETPCDFVDIRLTGYEQMFLVTGNSRREERHTFTDLHVRHEPKVLAVGARTFAGRFALPESVPAEFRGGGCNVHYTCSIHVSIPWWPDRRESFVVPVRWAPRAVGEPVPQTFATNTAGPTGGVAYMEASLDRTEVVAGETVSGSLSIANVGHTIRSVRATIVGIERRYARGEADLATTRLGAQIHEGNVPEGEPLRFRLVFPNQLAPSFQASLFRVDYQLELRADVAWGSDVVLRIPIVVHPRDSNAGKRVRQGRVAPVGRERRAVVWADVATRLALENDVEQERMLLRDGDVSLVVQLEPRDGDVFVSAAMTWPALGIDLGVARRGWADIFGGSGKLAVHAREDAQAAGLLGPELMDLLATLHDVHVDDCGSHFGHRGNAQVADRLYRIVARYKKIALLFAGAIPHLPPPAAMAEHVAAWEAYAVRLRGRFQRGGMWIRGASGTDVVEIGTLWGPKGEIAGTRVAVVLDPPMDADPEAPTTSAAARTELLELAAVATTHHTPNALAVLLPEPLPDPAAAEPWIERLCRAARALRGQTGAGPFR